jgi:2-oxoglutarate dehydrogenase E2 component (dihydrolipoamide succinyltransferase)
VKTVVAVIDASGAPAAAAPASPGQPTTAAKEESTAKPYEAARPVAPAATEIGARANREDVRSSPLVRRLARENNIDLTTVRGTGIGGRISKDDLLAAIAARSSAARLPQTAPASASGTAATAASHPAVPETAVPHERIYFGRYDVQPMSVMRQRIAEHMVLSKRISPHVYSIDEADMTHIAQLRSSAKDEFEKRHGTKLTFMPFFVRACADALRAFPVVNASVDGSKFVLHGEINIGIAVALEAGLIVPVVKDAGERTFADLQMAINDLAERARGKKLRPEEVQESTFSITNPGVFGGLMGMPVINQPNAAILAIGAIQKRPVVVDDDAIAVRSMVYLVLSYDHRIVDGAIAHQFMGRIKQRLETWSEAIL